MLRAIAISRNEIYLNALRQRHPASPMALEILKTEVLAAAQVRSVIKLGASLDAMQQPRLPQSPLLPLHVMVSMPGHCVTDLHGRTRACSLPRAHLADAAVL